MAQPKWKSMQIKFRYACHEKKHGNLYCLCVIYLILYNLNNYWNFYSVEHQVQSTRIMATPWLEVSWDGFTIIIQKMQIVLGKLWQVFCFIECSQWSLISQWPKSFTSNSSVKKKELNHYKFVEWEKYYRIVGNKSSQFLRRFKSRESIVGRQLKVGKKERQENREAKRIRRAALAELTDIFSGPCQELFHQELDFRGLTRRKVRIVLKVITVNKRKGVSYC